MNRSLILLVIVTLCSCFTSGVRGQLIGVKCTMETLGYLFLAIYSIVLRQSRQCHQYEQICLISSKNVKIGLSEVKIPFHPFMIPPKLT